ncbi:MAG: molecular chaperone HtpG [Bacteroidia bacterium]|nr:molecular chaperone HtpG [Bacteroidia bacterium]
MQKSGTISINTENIFPIIKKFLYSDQEIFLRELISNAVDATKKLQTLASVGEFQGELGDLTIHVELNKDQKTITIRDRGIGMTADEIERYINQIAFSGATEFLQKYQQSAGQIIGHFGLGFYSAFMVADKVEIHTKSWKDEPAAHWSCDGSTQFEITAGTRTDRGTDIILHISDPESEFLSPWRIREILRKYCSFLPVEISFEKSVINNTKPIWTRKPTELQESDYLEFYRELYPGSEPPLFWIHLNVDYPFTLTGVLYFPKIRPQMEINKNKINLYCNQVFITDSVENIVPDYLTLLHGIIDSPDIPLNVSRSYLQTDANVRKISNHISKKVADKLAELFDNDRSNFESKWEYIGTFIKFGMIKDAQFSERTTRLCLVKNLDDKLFTFDEYKEFVKEKQTDKNGKIVFLYSTNPEQQDTYISLARKKGYDVLYFDGILDMHFLNYIEFKLENVSIVGVDSDSLEKLIDKGIEKPSALSENQREELRSYFVNLIGKPDANVKTEELTSEDMPVIISRPEYQKRMKQMAQTGLFGFGDVPDFFNVILNTNHPIFAKLLLLEGEKKDNLAKQLYDLALISQHMLHGSDLTAYIERNINLLRQL